jgi:hypothetical protein
MYIIVKDVCGDYGDESKRVAVLNKEEKIEVFRSKNLALWALDAHVKNMNESYQAYTTADESQTSYSLYGGAEVYYIQPVFIDNSL